MKLFSKNITPPNKTQVILSALVLVGIIAWTTSQPQGSLLQASILNTSSDQITLVTDAGKITIDLYTQEAPIAARNLVGLTKRGKFNDMPFHETKEGLFLQTGDYENGDGTGGKSLWNEPFKDEFSRALTHKRGTVAMANIGPDTNASQFFILLDDRPYLDGRHTIVGKVSSGLDIADEISNRPSDEFNIPQEAMIISSAFVH